MSEHLRNLRELEPKQDEAGNGAAAPVQLLALPVVELSASEWGLREAPGRCAGCGECACGVAGEGEEG